MREIVEGGRLKGWKPAKRLKECRFQREEYYLGVPSWGGGYICYSVADWVEWIRVERSYAGSGLGVYSSAIWLHFFNGARKHLQFQRQNSGAK